MNKTLGLVALLVLAATLSGCLDRDRDTPGPDVAPDDAETPASRVPTPRPNAELDRDGTHADAPPWTLNGIDCTNQVFTFVADRDAVDAQVPDSLSVVGNGPTVLLVAILHRCAALVQDNTSLTQDAHLFSITVPVASPNDVEGTPRYWLTPMTDWPPLARSLVDAGIDAHLVDVATSGDPVERITLQNDSFTYRFEGSKSTMHDPASTTRFAMYAGAQAEFLFRYESRKESATIVPAAMTLTVEGGALGAIYPTGTTSVARTTNVGDLRISDRD